MVTIKIPEILYVGFINLLQVNDLLICFLGSHFVLLVNNMVISFLLDLYLLGSWICFLSKLL